MPPKSNVALEKDKSTKSNDSSLKCVTVKKLPPTIMKQQENSSVGHIPDKDLQNLPPLFEVPLDKQEETVVKKLRVCCIVYDFTITSNAYNRDVKRNILNELISYFADPDIPFSDFLYPEIVNVFSLNVFRAMPLQSSKPKQSTDSDDDEPVLEISWEHLELVYCVFLRFLEHPKFSTSTSKKSIDNRFIVRLLDVFETDDPREREALKTVLHRIYGKFINLRAFIRKQINNVFFSYIYENEKHNGIAELLEILGSIINGFQTPLKEEHKIFLRRVLLPLHKVRRLNAFHPQLAYCVKEFIIKEETLLYTVLVDGLIRFWPKVCSSKQIMFLHELEDCVECVDGEAFKLVIDPLFHLLSRCISSQHSQVTERVLLMFNNEAFVNLFKPHVETVLPIMFPCLFKAKQHWNKSLHQLVFNVLKLFMEMDPELFNTCTITYRDRRAKEKEANLRRQKDWLTIENLAKRNQSRVSLIPRFPQRKTSSSIRRKGNSNSTKENINGNKIGADTTRSNNKKRDSVSSRQNSEKVLTSKK